MDLLFFVCAVLLACGLGIAATSQRGIPVAHHARVATVVGFAGVALVVAAFIYRITVHGN